MKTSYSYVPSAAFSSQWAARRPSPKLKIELKSAQFAKKWSEVWIVLGGPESLAVPRRKAQSVAVLDALEPAQPEPVLGRRQKRRHALLRGR